MTDHHAPLAGIRVVDFTHIVAGPLCTQLLADGGAEIVKIEPPGGEWARNRGPRVPTPDGGAISSYFAALNRGKQSVVLDLKTEAGRQVARDLVAGADICLWNFLEGTMERLGLGLEVLRNDHPRLITAAITFLGDTASIGLPARPGLAIVAEAESGHTSLHRDDGKARARRCAHGRCGDWNGGLWRYSNCSFRTRAHGTRTPCDPFHDAEPAGAQLDGSHRRAAEASGTRVA